VSAFERLVRRTPLVPWPGRRDLHAKLENLQRTGSFKLRGAALRLDALDAGERARGVVAASAGNHGLGVALAGRALGVDVEVVVPATSPRVKRDGIAALGARVSAFGSGYDEAEAEARRRARDSGRVFVSPFDDPLVMRGNGGTLAEEILDEMPDVTRVVCPVGGGGLISGLAEVLAPRGVAVAGVQPERNCAMFRSLELGRALTVYQGEATLAEGCEGAVADSTYEICRRHRVSVALVSEDAIRRALAAAYRAGQVVEPTAAVGLAGVLEGAVPPSPRTVVVVTGANVDPDLTTDVMKPE
jgi:threonine dehydratase